MTLQSNYAIAIAKRSDWLNSIESVLSANEKQNQNQVQLIGVIFPALWAS